MARGHQASKVKITVAILAFLVLIAGLAVVGYHMYIRENYPLEYTEQIKKYSAEYQLDPVWVASLIRKESKYQVKAKSNKGAMGLMQIMPDSGAWIAGKMGIAYSDDRLNDPDYNIRMGCYYLRYLLDRFDGVKDTALAAYNGGPTNVAKWLKDTNYSTDRKTLSAIPLGETADYVRGINQYYEKYEKYYGEELNA